MSNYFTTPQMMWNRVQGEDLKVKDWIVPYYAQLPEKMDVIVTGIPLSRSSISPSAASEYPDFFRRAWNGFSTYSIDDDVDFRSFQVADVGDVRMHGTDILACHENIRQAMHDILQQCPDSFYVQIGGDHSITAPIVTAFQEHTKKQLALFNSTHT
nr:arginase family protein [Kurthia senegalensis]